MVDRQACERRVYRLALLLTGRRASAIAVTEQVIGAQADLSALDSAHLDRLAVLRSREQTAGRVELPGLEDAIAEAMAELPEQQREAVIFTRVYSMDERTAAKAMDCSYRAVQQHAQRAEATLRDTLDEQLDALAEQVRRAVMQVDVPEVYRQRQRRRRRVRRTLIVLAVAAGVLAALAGLSWLVQGLQAQA